MPKVILLKFVKKIVKSILKLPRHRNASLTRRTMWAIEVWRNSSTVEMMCLIKAGTKKRGGAPTGSRGLPTRSSNGDALLRIGIAW